VVDDGALVVGAEEHHPAEELDEIALRKAVRDTIVVEDAPQFRHHLRHVRREPYIRNARGLT
jgi:hypothetical protein